MAELLDNLPPVNHAQGFQGRDAILDYLSAFTDRPDTDVASYDLWGRATTFGDLRKLVRKPQESMFLQFE